MDCLEIEKSEAKYRRAHEDYKNSVSSYGNAREDFERKMTLATRRFQVIIVLAFSKIVKLLLINYNIICTPMGL
jgi:hypothetical protein